MEKKKEFQQASLQATRALACCISENIFFFFTTISDEMQCSLKQSIVYSKLQWNWEPIFSYPLKQKLHGVLLKGLHNKCRVITVLLDSYFIFVQFIYLVVKIRTGYFPEGFFTWFALKHIIRALNTVRQYAFTTVITEIQHWHANRFSWVSLPSASLELSLLIDNWVSPCCRQPKEMKVRRNTVLERIISRGF